MNISSHRMAVLIEMVKAAKKKKKKKIAPAPVYAAEDGANFKQGNTFNAPNKPRTKDTKKCPPGKVYRNGKCVKSASTGKTKKDSKGPLNPKQINKFSDTHGLPSNQKRGGP